jgi:anti-sigma B factor antagonist
MAVLNFDIKSVNLPSGDEAKAVFLSGSIDASTNQTFEGRLSDILSSGTNKVLLVLTNVKYINSTGLGTIVKCVDTFREQDGDIKLVGVPTKVIALFEMLGLLALFETYDTIEDALGSFGQTDTTYAGSKVQASVSFPLQFKHPITGMGLNVNQPGRFKDPRSGDYFSVGPDGAIEFYQTSKTQIVDLKLPCDGEFSASLISMATTLSNKLDMGAAVAAAVEASIDEACSLIAKNETSASDNCHILLVADTKQIQIGLVSSSKALSAAEDDPCLVAIKQRMDEITHKPLPGRGHLLTMSKRKA